MRMLYWGVRKLYSCIQFHTVSQINSVRRKHITVIAVAAVLFGKILSIM